MKILGWTFGIIISLILLAVFGWAFVIFALIVLGLYALGEGKNNGLLFLLLGFLLGGHYRKKH